MRLGSQVCHLHPGSKAHEIYGSEQIEERHRHRYEVNNNLLPQIKEAGLVIGGLSSDKTLVETVELPDHPWFFASQFHPELPLRPETVIRCSRVLSLQPRHFKSKSKEVLR